MEHNGDGKDFSHHLEMAHLHHKSMGHHLEQLKEMHGLESEGSADDGEEGQGRPKAFAGKETMEEEEAEKHPQIHKRRR